MNQQSSNSQKELSCWASELRCHSNCCLREDVVWSTSQSSSCLGVCPPNSLLWPFPATVSCSGPSTGCASLSCRQSGILWLARELVVLPLYLCRCWFFWRNSNFNLGGLWICDHPFMQTFPRKTRNKDTWNFWEPSFAFLLRCRSRQDQTESLWTLVFDLSGLLRSSRSHSKCRWVEL